jgi:small-conductance mechanosensitive channel
VWLQTSRWRAQAAEAARRARRRLLVLTPLLAIVVVAYVYRTQLLGTDRPVRFITAVAIVIIGWSLSRNLGQALEPRLGDRLGPGSAGVAGFVIRLATLVLSVLIGLRIAGLRPGALLVGASVTAIVIGLAAQQTVGNVFAGMVLLAARPFQLGDRVRFNGFGMDVEGTVAAHGLLYLTMLDGDDVVMVPNTTALAMSVRPLRQPAAVDMHARLPVGVDPERVQAEVQEAISVPTKGPPHVALEGFEGDEIVVRIRATPADPSLGGRLAREVLSAVERLHALDSEARRPREESEDTNEGGRGDGNASPMEPGARAPGSP